MSIHRLADQLTAANTIKQAESALTTYLSHFGFHHFAFTYYAGHIKSGRKLRYDYVSPALRPWHVHYLEQTYADVDRTLEDNFIITLPLFWDVDVQLATAKNNREQRIREESIEFGIHQGLSLPVHGPNHDFVCLTLHQCRKETTLVNYLEQQYEWLSATQIFYHHIKRILTVTQTTANFQLTRREEQCLCYTAQSWRVEQIAKALKISPRTVNFHLQNANKKLGTNNKYQAAFKYCQP